jgi:hypothetical protein
MRRSSQTIVAETVQDYIEISKDIITNQPEPPKKASSKSGTNRKRFRSSLMDNIRFQSLPQNLKTILEDQEEEDETNFDSDKENKLESGDLEIEHPEAEYSNEDFFLDYIPQRRMDKRPQDRVLILTHDITSPYLLLTQLFNDLEIKIHQLQEDEIKASVMLDSELGRMCDVVVKVIKGHEDKQELSRFLDANYYLFVHDNDNSESFKVLEKTLREISDPEIFRKSFLVGHQANSKTVSGMMTEETLKIEEELKFKGSVFTGLQSEEYKWAMIKSTILNYFP